MIKFENTVLPSDKQWKMIVMGTRNPKNSWDRSDSKFYEDVDFDPDDHIDQGMFLLGSNDLELMMKLRNAGTDHRKFMRMIVVYVDITAPLYWWKEFDTYKVGTVANSCSTMHKIHEKEFTLEDFSCEHLINSYLGEDADVNMQVDGQGEWTPKNVLEFTIDALNHYRNKFLETKIKPLKDESKRAGLMKKYWWQMIQLLPSSYNQRRTVMLNYEVLANIYKSRKNHKLDEWNDFCKWIEGLPYSELITGASLKDVPICNEIMEEAKRRVTNEEDKK